MQKFASARLDGYSAHTSGLKPKTRPLAAKPVVVAPPAPKAAGDAKTETLKKLANLASIFKGIAFGGPSPAGATTKSEPISHSLDVKTQNQFENTKDQNACGTTSLAMIMDYWNPGKAGNDHFTIDKDIRRADLYSTPDNLARYASEHGFRSSVKTEAGIDDIKSAIDKGLPVQVLIKPDGDNSSFTTHWVVVEGYETDPSGKVTGLKIADPAGGKYTADTETFKKQWSDLHYSNVNSGMSRVMVTYAPDDDRPIKGLDGVTRRAKDIELPGNSLWHDMWSNGTPARVAASGVSDIVAGAINFQPGTFVGGIVKAVGGAVGGILSVGGGYIKRAGQDAIDWGKRKWNQGGIGNKILGGLGIIGGGIAKGFGWAVQKVGNFVGWAFGKIGDGVRKVGDAIWNGIKKVGKAIANGAKAVWNGVKKAAKAVGNFFKKIFSGW